MPINLEPSVLYEKGREKMQPKLDQWLEAVKDVKANQAVTEVQAREVWNTWKAYWASLKNGNAESEVIGFALKTAIRRYVKDNKVFFTSLLLISVSIPLGLYYLKRKLKKKGRLRRTTSQMQHRSQFDYIIVGAGPSGCVLANRLTEDPTVSVLLVEAGSIDNNTLHRSIPAFMEPLASWFDTFWKRKPSFQWDYKAVPAPFTNNRTIGLNPQNQSAPNTKIIHVRGNKNDFNSWESVHGCTGWNFQRILPYFKKSEANHIPPKVLDRGFHSISGVIGITVARPHKTSISHAFLQACQFMGVGYAKSNYTATATEFLNGSANLDYNGSNQFGSSFVQLRMRNGRPSTCAARAYIDDLIDPFSDLHRSNLTVLMGHVASRVSCSGNSKGHGSVTIDGVTLVRSEDSNTCRPLELFVQATREVILCCGAIGTPSLLLNSGIGPTKHIQEMGIDVVADIPAVGKNLQSHILVPAFQFEDIGKPTLLQALASSIFNKSREIEATAFLNSPNEDSASDSRPNIQLLFTSSTSCTFPNKNEPTLPDSSPQTIQTLQISPILLHPKSRGCIQLTPSSPTTASNSIKPVEVHANHLADDQDVETLISALQTSRNIFSEMQKLAPDRIGAEIVNHEPLLQIQSYVASGSTSTQQLVNQKEYLKQFVMENSVSTGDFAGTCRMGPSSETRDTVVSHLDLKVHGFSNLRIADSSIMPEIVSGNVTASVIMIGEVCSDMIKQEGTFSL